jgi:UDP-N-acetylglucosamine diphosphorylase / glucose-1-phosphate thymidylyltransferase / UDP-N-acetylgalactosamine diphosphorylase / glucosamine-1-phosphate N-acetyltransferase / galactosamine-1-phosphate N-acetyltransferase
MQAVILAAGRGKRLHPLTDDLPKGMLPLNGKPLLQIILEQLKSVNINEVTIVVHYFKDKIINYFKDGSQLGLKINYVEQKEMKGTADAVLHAENTITSNKFICIACDSLFENGLLNKLLQHNSDGVITCREVEDTKPWGILRIENNRVIEMVEKSDNPPSNLANFSVYLFPRDIFNKCKLVQPSLRGELEINDAIKMLIDEGKHFTSEKSSHIIDVGTFEQLSEAEKIVRELGL